ncbi:SusE domain-containing protein, partial [Staphylococcus pseudintermedius]|uniref:SusE domain-containing protein n=1 Tax=Staphylococcus pseudintermedius TaxID=283734 RepID=UPI0036F2D707
FTPAVQFTNMVEFAVAGTNFNPSTTREVSMDQNTFSLTHLQLNNILADLNIAPNTSKPIEVRLKSNVNTVTSFYSKALTVNMTGYT